MRVAHGETERRFSAVWFCRIKSALDLRAASGGEMMESPADVLLVEDNPGDADLVRLRLIETDPPVRVDCVTRLSDALKSLAKKTPALILLDLDLPDSHGAETFRRVLEKAPNIPIVILSGQDDEKLAMKAVHHGVQDYLIKNDITSKQLERAVRYAIERQGLLRSLEMARKAQLEFKNLFLSHVSHELRTPLTCIHQYVSLVLDGLAGPVSTEQAEHLQTVLKGVGQLHGMIRDLLEATRAESGKMRIEPRCISIEELIGQALAMMKVAADQKKIKLEASVDPAIPLVYADPDRILEVLINLLDNGIKFTPEEGSVSVKACMVETDPSAVYLSVTDTGRGISQQALPRIFERMFQDGDGVNGSRTGLGLGLYIAKEIISLHGGRVWAASDPGNGSAFSFHLPVYSLERLIGPVITEKGRLRPSFVLVRAVLTPLTTPPLGNWKETCQQALEAVRNCVYVDRDLVLPPVASHGFTDTIYVVASTDMLRVGIMLQRVEEQLKAVPHLSASGRVKVTAEAVQAITVSPEQTLEQQIQTVAQRVQETILSGMATPRRPINAQEIAYGSSSIQ
jgi:sigma-B regulation protein RsbU (phosphoserine phosphatase)